MNYMNEKSIMVEFRKMNFIVKAKHKKNIKKKPSEYLYCTTKRAK